MFKSAAPEAVIHRSNTSILSITYGRLLAGTKILLAVALFIRIERSIPPLVSPI